METVKSCASPSAGITTALRHGTKAPETWVMVLSRVPTRTSMPCRASSAWSVRARLGNAMEACPDAPSDREVLVAERLVSLELGHRPREADAALVQDVDPLAECQREDQ